MTDGMTDRQTDGRTEGKPIVPSNVNTGRGLTIVFRNWQNGNTDKSIIFNRFLGGNLEEQEGPEGPGWLT